MTGLRVPDYRCEIIVNEDDLQKQIHVFTKSYAFIQDPHGGYF